MTNELCKPATLRKLTRDTLITILRNAGAVGVSKLRKEQLLRVTALASKGEIPIKYLPLKKIGDTCTPETEQRCRTKTCRKSTCASRKTK